MARTKTNSSVENIAAIYIRVSTQEQQKNGYSLEYQVEACRKYMKAKELAEFKIYADPGVSGTVPVKNRAGFSKLLEDAEAKKFGVLVFYAFDRLARDMVIAYNIIGLLGDLKIKIAECQHNINTATNDGKTRMAMHFTFAQMEHGIIKERSKNGTLAKKKKQGWIGGRVPFGYKKPDSDKDSIPIIHPVEGKVVNLIYRLYWKDHKSLAAIVRYLDDHGVKSGKYNDKKNWSSVAIMRILRENYDKYCGCVINDNENGICWPKILDKDYPVYPR